MFRGRNVTVYGLFVWITAIGTQALSSCSIPLSQHELSVGYFSHNHTTGSDRRIIPGIDIRSQPMKSIGLGWSSFTLLRPSTTAEATPSPDGESRARIRLPLAVVWTDDQGTTKTLGWALLDSPQTRSGTEGKFIHQVRLGASIQASPSPTGLQIGYRNVTTMTVNQDESAIYRLDYHSNHLSRSKLIKTKPKMSNKY